MVNRLTVNEVARRLNKTPRWIRELCQTGQLKADKLGRDWLIDPKSVEQYEHGQNGKVNINN
jgi:DNA (cytosine-5)-methyltransferase 1